MSLVKPSAFVFYGYYILTTLLKWNFIIASSIISKKIAIDK